MAIVDKSEELAIWFHCKIDGLEIPNTERSRLSASSFDVVLEHQQAITILIKNKLYGSAFTLARSVYEAYINGLWLQHCASEKQIQYFLKNKLSKTFGELIAEIEKNEGYTEGVLSKTKKSGWALLNSFTHTGFNQLVRRTAGEFIEPNYTEEDVCKIIDFINSIALLAGSEITFLAGKTELSIEFLEKIKSYANTTVRRNHTPSYST